MATSSLEVRMARLEGAYEQVNERLTVIEQRLGRMEGKFDEKFDGLAAKIEGLRRDLEARIDAKTDGLRRDMNRQSFWILTLILISILLPLATRFA